jgi:hypothetical protein
MGNNAAVVVHPVMTVRLATKDTLFATKLRMADLVVRPASFLAAYFAGFDINCVSFFFTF